ncbi:meiotic nuclear division protein 1 homolog [Phtheirospermum japonicum]|uniref:Meiotic nuclear division protein 1 homolog n=1 Tax=Phtheirospermum japonicum TaxID=374723 RepID=A0A830CSN8_9LAMI|nr:meiotic nuclear division protein 1 homolog [Phtheirospermum japonicum]
MESKKRGLSLDEKREKMLQIFYESQDFFLLKELEKSGPKKGVISQSVKDVVQTLVDDDLVFKDKIGTSVYFWSLPSCAGNQLRNIQRKLNSDLQSSESRYAELIDQCDSLKKGREESDERVEALDDLKAIEQKYNELKVKSYFNPPPLSSRLFYFDIESEAKEQLDHLYAEVGITDDFDYLELPAAVPLSSPGHQVLEGSL